MADFIKIEFDNLANEQKDIIIAWLNEMNYEGFEEEGDILRAYISSQLYNGDELREFTRAHTLSFDLSAVKDTNWNKDWEANFQPVVVNDFSGDIQFAAIRADFHAPINSAVHEIIITPKMSFGTGHHATTAMMMKMMSRIDFGNKAVLDFGTGTGILAILAEKMGAVKVIAIDNDYQSIDNAAENFRSNGMKRIDLIYGSSLEIEVPFNIILANIVKTVILQFMPVFKNYLAPDGIILFSGLLPDDEQSIVDSATRYGLHVRNRIETNGWICLQMMFKDANNWC